MNIVIMIFTVSKISRFGMGPTQHTSQSVLGAVSLNIKEQEHEVERSHPSSVGVRMSATVLLFPSAYICTIMAYHYLYTVHETQQFSTLQSLCFLGYVLTSFSTIC